MIATHKVPEYAPKNDAKYFGIDYDDTYTVCPKAFRVFVEALKTEGHSAYFVTFRGPESFDPVKQAADALGIPAIATDGNSKREAVESLGVFIDVWIDDMPDLIVAFDGLPDPD